MAKHIGSEKPYGWGHPKEHSRASKLGWLRRKSHELDYARAATGSDVRRRKDETGHIVYTMEAGGEYYDLDPAEYRRQVRDGKAIFQSNERRGRQDEQHRQEIERYQARIRREEERQRAAVARKNAREARQAQEAVERLRQREEKDAARRAKDREREARAHEHFSRTFLRNDLYEQIRRSFSSGIRPYKGGHSSELYEAVPQLFRTKAKDRAKGYGTPMDEVAAMLSEVSPWLGIHTDDDLARVFRRIHRMTGKAWRGGGLH